MHVAMQCQYEFAQMEHEQRMREAERFRRAAMARQAFSPKTAAHDERRFFFSRFFRTRFQFFRPSEA
jgi:hypothetical protein